jgi:hypothetical protein
MQILGLLGMYFDAVMAEVKTCLLLFRLALAILWVCCKKRQKIVPDQLLV